MTTEPAVRLLTRQQAASELTTAGYPMTAKTLATLACRGGGPQFLRFGGRRVLYRLADLFAWAEGRLVEPRSPAAPRPDR